jgi:ElaB/YqjD/DUF883 family membrane-anchored ribosome-binding protein
MAEFNRPGSTPVQPRRDLGRQETGQGQGESSLGNVMGTVSEQAQQFAQQAQQVAGEAGQRMQRFGSQAADRAEDAWEDVSGWVRRNPVPTLLIVAGVGLLFALAFTTATSASSSSERRW